MPKVEDTEVFEYTESEFERLKQEDEGYYPSKHDKIAFEKTASFYGISVEEVGRIYDVYSQKAANIMVSKLNKLPSKVRREQMLEHMSNIMRENRDLPFWQTEGEPTEAPQKHGDFISDEYSAIIEKVANKGWTLPLSIDINQYDALRKATDEEVDQFFIQYYCERKIRLVERRVKKAIVSDAQRIIFEQAMAAYHQDLFAPAVITLTTVLEHLLSQFGDDPRDVRMMRICKFNAEDQAAKGKPIKSLCWKSMYEYIRILYEKK